MRALMMGLRFGIAQCGGPEQRWQVMKAGAQLVVVGAGLLAVGIWDVGWSAEPAGPEPFPVNYQLEIELAPKEGTARLFKVVTTGERVRGGFVVPATSDQNSEPVTLNFEAEFEALSAEKVWVRNFVLGYHMGVARRVVRPEPGGPMPELRTEPPGPAGPGGERARLMDRRRLRDAGQPVEPLPGELEPGGRDMPRRPEGPAALFREMQPMESMLNSSVLLTVGQPLVVREDPTGWVSLTIRRLEK